MATQVEDGKGFLARFRKKPKPVQLGGPGSPEAVSDCGGETGGGPRAYSAQEEVNRKGLMTGIKQKFSKGEKPGEHRQHPVACVAAALSVLAVALPELPVDATISACLLQVGLALAGESDVVSTSLAAALIVLVATTRNNSITIGNSAKAAAKRRLHTKPSLTSLIFSKRDNSSRTSEPVIAHFKFTSPDASGKAAVYTAADEESPVAGHIAHNSIIGVVEISDSWLKTQSGGWVPMQSTTGSFDMAKKTFLTPELRENCTAFYTFYCPEKLPSLEAILAKRESSEDALKKMWDLMQKRYGPWPPLGWAPLQRHLSELDEELVQYTTLLLREGFDKPTLEMRGLPNVYAERIGLPVALRRYLTPPPPSPTCSSVSDMSLRGKVVSVAVQKAKGGVLPFTVDEDCMLTGFTDDRLGLYVTCRLAAVNDKVIGSKSDVCTSEWDDEESLMLTITEADRLMCLGNPLEVSRSALSVDSVASTSTSKTITRMFHPGDRVLFNTKESGWIEGAEIDAYSTSPECYDIRLVATGEVLKDWKESNLKPVPIIWTRENATQLDTLTRCKEAGEPYDEEVFSELKLRNEQYIEQGLKRMQSVSPRHSPAPKKRFGFFSSRNEKAKDAMKRFGRKRDKQAKKCEEFSINTSNPNTRAQSNQRVSCRPPNLVTDGQGRPAQGIMYGGEMWWWVVAEEQAMRQPLEESTNPLNAAHLRAARFEACRRRHNVGRTPSVSSLAPSELSSSSSEDDDAVQLDTSGLVACVDATLRQHLEEKTQYPHLEHLYYDAKEELVEEGMALDDYQDRDHIAMRSMFPYTKMLLRCAEVAAPSEASEFSECREKPLEDREEQSGYGAWCRLVKEEAPATTEDAVALFIKHKSKDAFRVCHTMYDSDGDTIVTTATSPPLGTRPTKDPPLYALSPLPASSMSRCSTGGSLSLSPRNGSSRKNPRQLSTPVKPKQRFTVQKNQ